MQASIWCAAMFKINKYSCIPKVCILLVYCRKDREKEEEGADNRGIVQPKYKACQIVTNTRKNGARERN